MSSELQGLSAASSASLLSSSEPFSRPRNERGMDLTRLLNEPLPPMRTPPQPEAGTTSSHRLESAPSLTSSNCNPRSDPRPAETKFAPPVVEESSSTASTSTPSSLHPDYDTRSFTDSVLCSSSRATVESALEGFRRQSHSVIDFQHSTNLSVYAVQEAFKSLNSWPGTHLDLWAAWSQITWLTELARVPTFPINPDKIALLLSVYVDLPCSRVTREMMRHRQTLLEPDQVLLLLHAMEVAGKASKDFWPEGTSFLRSATHYPSTTLVRTLLNTKAATQKPVLSGFAPPKPPPPPRSIVHPPVSNFYGPKSANPAPTRQSRLSLRDLCSQLPSILADLKLLPDEPQVFDVAQVRFQNASSAPAYVTRMPDLVQAAVLYTNVTALLCFPTYPIEAIKLAVFGLAFTPGPLSQFLLEASPEFARQRQYENKTRLTGKETEKLMKDLTAVRDITRGGSVGIPEGEMRDWQEWSKELVLDWKSIEPAEPKGAKERARPSQNGGGPPRKRAKRSPSPSTTLKESVKTVSDRPSISKKETFKPPPASDRSTPAPSVVESASSSDATATTTKPKGKGRPKKPKATTTTAKKTAKKPSNLVTTSKARKNTPSNSSRASTPASSVTSVSVAPSVSTRPALFPRWTPEVKGKVPEIIPMPPVPPIRPSTRWLKQNRIKVNKDEDGSVEDDAGDDDDEEEEAPRTIAASRPKRRGGLQMIPVDIEALWDLARKNGYTEDAMDEAMKTEQT
ncbi:uncharacterized protein JCM6883_006024 [Sporobolomyces salmoneus]|uniref:uncharacterized protein n=1 Tax=Sporobolomyces salmoneus TaxID=183962 RepID=UPI0031767C70